MEPDALVTALDRAMADAAARPALATLLDLHGRVAVVTSGGGLGLGQALCHRLASQGAIVVVNDIDPTAARDMAAAVAARWAVPTTWTAEDVTAPGAAERVVAAAEERCGPVDILVNSVGGGSNERPLPEMSAAAITALVDLNLLATVWATRAVLPGMIERARGAIVNISSEGTRVPGTPALYGALKAAIDTLTRKLAEEVSPHGVRINAVSPGSMASPRLRDAAADTCTPPGYADMIRAGVERTALGRPGQAEEVADAVVFLASDAAAFIQGVTLPVAGGLR